jgi:hypothetical protein
VTSTFTVEMLPARNGDALWISYGDDKHLLVDCGHLAKDAAAARITDAGRVELFIVTHMDADHIGDAIPLLADPECASRIGDVWFNGRKQLNGFLSARQADEFTKLLDRDDRRFRWNGRDRVDVAPPPIVMRPPVLPEFHLAGGMSLTVLSPTPVELRKLALNWRAVLQKTEPDRRWLRRERPSWPDLREIDVDSLARTRTPRDRSVTNASSIAVLAEFDGRAVLLAGDAHAGVLAAGIRALQKSRHRPGERLHLDAFKLAHHGSANATTRDLLDLIDCRNYLISTDGSGGHYHPDRAAIARLIRWGGPAPRLHFNYRNDFTAFWGDADLSARHGHTAVYPESENAGLAVVV